MRFKAAVFDFDGTLVASAPAKRKAFFDIFPAGPDYAAVIDAVLAADPDGSRHDVIPRMTAQMSARGLELPAHGDAAGRIAAYGEAALRAVQACPEHPGATALLTELHRRCLVYLVSNTPHDALQELVNGRGWAPLFHGVFGHPHDKTETLAAIMGEHSLATEDVAMVGDGVSDAAAAVGVGCRFFEVREPGDLARHLASWGIGHA